METSVLEEPLEANQRGSFVEAVLQYRLTFCENEYE